MIIKSTIDRKRNQLFAILTYFTLVSWVYTITMALQIAEIVGHEMDGPKIGKMPVFVFFTITLVVTTLQIVFCAWDGWSRREIRWWIVFGIPVALMTYPSMLVMLAPQDAKLWMTGFVTMSGVCFLEWASGWIAALAACSLRKQAESSRNAINQMID